MATRDPHAPVRRPPLLHTHARHAHGLWSHARCTPAALPAHALMHRGAAARAARARRAHAWLMVVATHRHPAHAAPLPAGHPSRATLTTRR
eukprot:3126399-Prymnesium_polylepis.2